LKKPLQIEGTQVTYPGVDERANKVLQNQEFRQDNAKRLEQMERARNKIASKQKKIKKILVLNH